MYALFSFDLRKEKSIIKILLVLPKKIMEGLNKGDHKNEEKVELGKHKDASGILSEQEKSILANKNILFIENRKLIVEKYLARISRRESDNFVFNDMEIDDESAAEFIGKKITEKFIEQVAENYNERVVSWSIASTLDAVADKNPDNQPLGVDVIELAKQNNLPAVLITAKGHVKGEEAVHIVDTFLKQKTFAPCVLIFRVQVLRNQ